MSQETCERIQKYLVGLHYMRISQRAEGLMTLKNHSVDSNYTRGLLSFRCHLCEKHQQYIF